MIFDEIKIGTNGELDLLVKAIQNLKARNGQPYQSLTCMDLSGNVKKLNNFKTLIQETKLPICITGNVRCDLYMNNKTYLMEDYKPNDKLTLSDFRPKTEIDPQQAWKDIIKLIKTIKDEYLCRLACRIISNNKEAFMVMPLNMSSFNRTNGLLEATFKLMQMVDRVTSLIDYLDRDVMITAATIFYIGQVRATNENFEYTSEDVLLGPGVLSLEELIKVDKDVRSDLKEGDTVPEDKITILKHLIISRDKGHYAAIPEAIALLHLDEILQETEEVHSIVSTLGDGGYVDRYYPKRNRIYKVPGKNE